MRIGLTAAAIAMAVSASGCAIQPTPQDVTGVSTYNIARQIRCETRTAVIHAVARWLANTKGVSEQSKTIGEKLLSNEFPLDRFSPALLGAREQPILRLFWNTGVVYDFVLEAEEKNDLNAEVNLFRLFTGNKGTLGLHAGLDRRRQNKRTFAITDTFSKLVRNIPPDYCKDRIVEENVVYPMAGKVGVDKALNDFVNLTLFGNLTAREASKRPEGPPTYVIELEFETKVSGSAAPKIEFSPVRSVSNASLTASVERTDTHRLTLGFAIGNDDAAQIQPTRSALFDGPFLTARPTTQSEIDAATAVSRFKANNLFSGKRAIIISQ